MSPAGLTSKRLYHLVRWFMAFIFVYAGAVKLPFPQQFALAIADFGLVLDEAVFPLAVAIPLLEIAAGIGIALDIRGSLTILAAVTTVFCAALIYGIWLGLDIDCGCFELGTSRGSSTGLVAALARDAALLVCCSYLFWWRYHHGARPRELVTFIKALFQQGGQTE
jgi:hypothetical protein